MLSTHLLLHRCLFRHFPSNFRSERILWGILLNEHLDLAGESVCPTISRRWPHGLRTIFSVLRPGISQAWICNVWFLTYVETFYPISSFSEQKHKLQRLLLGLSGLKRLLTSNSFFPKNSKTQFKVTLTLYTQAYSSVPGSWGTIWVSYSTDPTLWAAVEVLKLPCVPVISVAYLNLCDS